MMKKVLLLPLAVFAVFSLFAQPVLQGNVVPNVGDFVYFAIADSNSAQPGNAGANQVWNFSAMQPIYPVSLNQYLAPAGTPYAGDFPTATQVIKEGNGDTATYAYARKDANQYLILGLRSMDYAADYSDPDAQLHYPVNFNGTYSETFAYTTDAGTGVVFQSTGTHLVKYDAYGTLTTPLGTFNNAIRIKAVTTQKDSANFAGTDIINHYDFITYDWLVPNKPGVVTGISYIHILTETRVPGIDTFISETGPNKTVNYISTATTDVFSAPTVPAGLNITALGPNPADNELNLRFTSENGGRVLNLLIIDVTGRVVKSQTLIASAGENDYVIPVSQLAAGTYQLTLLDKQKVLTRSWIKQ